MCNTLGRRATRQPVKRRRPTRHYARSDATTGMPPGHLATPGPASPENSQLGGGTTGSGDLLLGRLAERVRRNLQRHATQLAGAEHLHRLATTDRAGVGQLQRTDLATVREQLGEPVQVHDLEDDLVLVLEA